MKDATYTESTGTLTLGDIKKAINLLKEGDEQALIHQAKRALKDWSKLGPFNEQLKLSKMTVEEQVELSWVIQNLAEGKVLVLGEKMHREVIGQLKLLQAPKEVLDNILVSRFLPSETTGISIKS